MGEKHNVLILSSHVFPVQVPLAWFSLLVATKQTSIALYFSEDFEPKSILSQDTESSDLLGLLSRPWANRLSVPFSNAKCSFCKRTEVVWQGFYHSRLNRLNKLQIHPTGHASGLSQILSRGYRHVSQCLVLESNLDERSWTHTCWSVWFMRWFTTMRRIQQFRQISNPNLGITTIGPNSHVSRRPWACASYASCLWCPRFFDVAFQGLQHSSTLWYLARTLIKLFWSWLYPKIAQYPHDITHQYPPWWSSKSKILLRCRTSAQAHSVSHQRIDATGQECMRSFLRKNAELKTEWLVPSERTQTLLTWCRKRMEKDDLWEDKYGMLLTQHMGNS